MPYHPPRYVIGWPPKIFLSIVPIDLKIFIFGIVSPIFLECESQNIIENDSFS